MWDYVCHRVASPTVCDLISTKPLNGYTWNWMWVTSSKLLSISTVDFTLCQAVGERSLREAWKLQRTPSAILCAPLWTAPLPFVLNWRLLYAMHYLALVASLKSWRLNCTERNSCLMESNKNCNGLEVRFAITCNCVHSAAIKAATYLLHGAEFDIHRTVHRDIFL